MDQQSKHIALLLLHLFLKSPLSHVSSFLCRLLFNKTISGQDVARQILNSKRTTHFSPVNDYYFYELAKRENDINVFFTRLDINLKDVPNVGMNPEWLTLKATCLQTKRPWPP